MQLYKRMIRPMIEVPTFQGFRNEGPYCLEDDPKWYPEEEEFSLRRKWKEEVDKIGMAHLFIQRGFFEVSPQELKEILKNQTNAE